MESHAVGRRHFGIDAVAGQEYLVVSGPCGFFRPVGIGPESGGRIVLPSAGVFHLAGNGHDGDVEEVADTGAAKVGVGESDDGGVRFMVAGAPVPALGDAGRAQLDHTVGDIGSYEHVAVPA